MTGQTWKVQPGDETTPDLMHSLPLNKALGAVEVPQRLNKQMFIGPVFSGMSGAGRQSPF